MVFVQFWPTDEGLIYIAVKSPLFEVVSGGGKVGLHCVSLL